MLDFILTAVITVLAKKLSPSLSDIGNKQKLKLRLAKSFGIFSNQMYPENRK